jgi:hypothetical protein
MRTLALVVALISAVGCGNSSSSSNNDLSTDLSMSVDMRLRSQCGQPGDTGNDIGVGKFCMTQDDCMGNGQATVCSVLLNDPSKPDENTYFCTLAGICNPSGPNNCGMNASCVCRNGLCGCAPDRCPRPGG